jgi:hypothetical protein
MINKKIKLENYHLDLTKIKYLNLDSYNFWKWAFKICVHVFICESLILIAWGVNVNNTQQAH